MAATLFMMFPLYDAFIFQQEDGVPLVDDEPLSDDRPLILTRFTKANPEPMSLLTSSHHRDTNRTSSIIPIKTIIFDLVVTMIAHASTSWQESTGKRKAEASCSDLSRNFQYT
jgi:hypothetical protein